jgi:biopolymer transport protein ExbB
MSNAYRKQIVTISALAALAACVAQAQTVAPAVAQEAQWNTLWDYWKVGGFAMYPIGLCSVGVVALAVYCGMQYRTLKMIQPDLVQPLRDALTQLDVAQAVTVCNGSPGILTNILGAGLKRIGEDGTVDVANIEKAMEEASIEEVNSGMKPLTYMSVLSQVAPMFGLLGTVTGMIGAFNKIGMGAMGDPEKLAADIGEAMITTAFGLMVAIPAMFGYFGFKAHYTSNVSRISRVLGDMVHNFADSYRKAGGQHANVGGATVL